MRRFWLGALVLLAVLPLSAGDRPQKKLLEYGWDVPYPDYVRANIAKMEEKPFDGLVFRLKNYHFLFDRKAWTAADLQPQMDDLKATQWRRFTDNFLTLYSANDAKVSWFDDAQWTTIESNMRLLAEAARVGRCVGICFDAEPYGANPWVYDAKTGKSFWETEQAARRRGAQFIGALQAVMPDVKLLTFFQLSLFGHLCDIDDPVRRAAALAGQSYALLPAFLNGMLEVAAPNVRIIDGNENSYYYTAEIDYLRAYHLMKQRALTMVTADNRSRYVAQVQAGVALYVDQVFALRGDTKVLANYLEPAERARFFEHNVYWALRTTDEYVWLYSEKMNWWKNELPADLEQAVVSAREKVAAGKPLGFDLQETIKRAQQRQKEQVAARLIRRSASIVARANQPAPVIDGKLDDPLWAAVKPLEPFVPTAESSTEKPATTTAQVTWDPQHLYVAFRCAEPQVKQLKAVGSRKDDPVWEGDSVELFCSTGPGEKDYRHFILGPHGVQWDGASGEETDDVTWNGDWLGKAAIGAGEWTAELAIPWQLLGGAPKPGDRRRANLCRQRTPKSELSCWSATVRGFIEPELFGTWSF